MLRCLIVDDSSPFFNAARDLLEHQGASVVGVARTSDEAVRRVEELHPDVTLVDFNLAEESGFELARRLSGDAGVAPGQLILISTQARDEFADPEGRRRSAGTYSPRRAAKRAAHREEAKVRDGAQHRLLVETAINTGLRWGELIVLKPRHLDLHKRTLTVGPDPSTTGSRSRPEPACRSR